MRIQKLLLPVFAGALVAGCVDLELTNPNQASSETFWTTEKNAEAGLTSVYGWVQQNGTYGRWLPMTLDFRSDIGMSRSPWGDLANIARFTFQSYDFEVNWAYWIDHYITITRANQVINNVPSIDMNESARTRIVGEAQFLRGLMYFNLAVLYGNVPLLLDEATPQLRPEQGTTAQVWAQVEADLAAAVAALPVRPPQTGRATRGAALALLGKAQLQQRKWNEAAQTLQQVIALEGDAGYRLLDNFGDLFTATSDNNAESVFEVQFAGEEALPQGIRGHNLGRMFGPCGVGFCDGEPTQWYFQQFFREPTVAGGTDPRLDVTIFWNKPGGMDVHGQSYVQRYGAESNRLFWRKYTNWWEPGQTWDAHGNIYVIRYADVLLMYAEALNEANRAGEAIPFVNRVRQRARLAALPGNMGQAALRDEILHQRLLEFGLEHQRWLDLMRHNLVTAQTLPTLKARDPEFDFFIVGKSELLPIPQREVDLNPNVNQNPGW